MQRDHPSGVKLTVLAGTVVKSLPSTGLFVQGTLNAAGTKDNSVVFTSIKQDAYGGDSNGDGSATTPAAGNWYGLFLDGVGASASLLDHAIIEYGGQPLNNWHGASWTNDLVFWQAAATLQNSQVRFGDWGVYVQQAAVNLYSNTIVSNTNSGVYVAATSYPTITANVFQNNGRCAIDVPVDDIPNITNNQLECCVLPRLGQVLCSARHTLFGKEASKNVGGGLALLELVVNMQDQGVNKRLGLLTTRLPDGFGGQVTF